ncbi:hypothetical protein CsSME_00031049 [Camellia sinensis var. sinensis]
MCLLFILATTCQFEFMLIETCFQWRAPFLVRLRSSPPLETKFNAIETFASSTCSSVRDILVAPYPFSSLAFSVAAPLSDWERSMRWFGSDDSDSVYWLQP